MRISKITLGPAHNYGAIDANGKNKDREVNEFKPPPKICDQKIQKHLSTLPVAGSLTCVIKSINPSIVMRTVSEHFKRHIVRDVISGEGNR